MLLQFRVVVTGILFQFIFSRYLTCRQWFSLCLLTIGCMIKHIDYTNLNTKNIDASDNHLFNKHFFLIILQVFSSCFAGVYNEWLIKKTKNMNNKRLDIWVHNSFFCVQSIFCCLVYLFCIHVNLFNMAGIVPDEIRDFSIGPLVSMPVLLIILNNAAAGLITSLFLSSLNSILKTYASALELVMTAFLTRLIFDVPLNLWTFVSISLILVSTYIYAKNPVKDNECTVELPRTVVSNKSFYRSV